MRGALVAGSIEGLMEVTLIAWAALVIELVGLLLADLFLLHRGTHAVSTRNAA
jgi:hypothetical protein